MITYLLLFLSWLFAITGGVLGTLHNQGTQQGLLLYLAVGSLIISVIFLILGVTRVIEYTRMKASGIEK